MLTKSKTIITKNKKIEIKPLVTAGAPVDFRDSWRIFKIVAEFVEGYQFLSEVKKEVTILVLVSRMEQIMPRNFSKRIILKGRYLIITTLAVI